MKVGIVGGGHNGLVLAGYLARTGCDVTVYEAREKAGGLCVNEEIFPGHTISTVATYFGMFRRQFIEDLQLDAHGLQPYLTDPAEIVLLPDDGYVFTPRDGSDSSISAGTLSETDLAGWKKFWGDLGRGAGLISKLYYKPETTRKQIVDLFRENGLDVLADKVFDGSLFELFDQYCGNQYLKAAVATCTPGYASYQGSVFGCMHHGTAETCGVEGAWGLVRGGMGMVSESLARSARAAGVKVFTSTPVKKILIENQRATGLELADGSIEHFDVIVSNADPVTTFTKLMDEKRLPDSLTSWLKARGEDTPEAVSAGKVHLLLKRLPNFPVLDKLNHNYSGIIVITPKVEQIIADSNSVPKGNMPENLMLTMAFPTVSDETVAPEGQHHFNIDIHQLPIKDGESDWNDKNKNKILDAVVDCLKLHAPDISDVIKDANVVSPGDLKSRYGVSTSLCWHLPMTSEYVFEKRVLPGCKPYGSPIANLYLCGAAEFGGGNVTGIAGYNCAKVLTSMTAGVSGVGVEHQPSGSGGML